MEPKNKVYYVYVLLAADNTLYTGFTDDVAKRFKAHQEFKGAKFTKIKSKHPLKLLYSEQYPNKSAALSAEWHFKHQTRQQKLAYLASKQIYI